MLQGLVRFLLPRDDHWFDMLEELGRLGQQASKALLDFGVQTAVQVRDSVQSIEHKADDVVRRMEEDLARTFVTPIDREDLHRLTTELDDIIDLMNLSARCFTLYHVGEPTEAMRNIMGRLEVATSMIAEAMPKLRTHQYQALIEDGRKIRAIEKEADTIYRNAISELFSKESIDPRELLKQKEALDDLENAVDHCDRVADTLANLAVKHG